MIFTVTLVAVAVLLLTAVPGYIFIKRRMLSEDCISGLSKVMLYACQPCLAVYTFSSATLSADKLRDIGIFALLCILINVILLGGSYIVLRKKCADPIYRVMTIAMAFSNCAFFGIPIIEAILPESVGELMIYTTVFAVVMNIIGWTLGAAIISGDTKYISVKKIFLNPATIGLAVAFVIFIFSIPIHPSLSSMIEIMGRSCTPISMIIMGMRLATIKLPSLFTDLRVYLTVAVKQFVMPLVAFAIVYFLPLDCEVKQTFFIISACPVASVVLNFAEIVGAGQREAAKILLLGTILSVITLPVMMLMLPLLS